MPVAFGIARTIARSVIPSYIKRGFAANAIQRDLIKRGLGYYRKDLLKDVREFNGMMKMEKYTRAAAGNVPFPKFGMIEHKLKLDERYFVHGVMHGYHKVTGKELWQPISFYDTENRGKDGWEEAFGKQYDLGTYTAEETYDSLEIFSVEHNRKWSY